MSAARSKPVPAPSAGRKFEAGVGWSGYLEARNLFDTRYISTTITADVATPASAQFNPGYGRAIYGGLRYRM